MDNLFAIGAMFDEFLDQLLADPILRPRFAKLQNLDRYRNMMGHVFKIMLSNSPLDMDDVARHHTALCITNDEAAAWLACLRRVLSTFTHNNTDVDHLVSNVALCVDLIVRSSHAHLTCGRALQQLRAMVARHPGMSIDKGELLEIIDKLDTAATQQPPCA